MSRTDLEAGQTWEGFTLVEHLGTGTFADVFSATSAEHREPVALKISREPVTEEATALRALREIRILGSLTNRHVVHIYDHGLGADERWYMVMELLTGHALADDPGYDEPWPPGEALRVVHEACLGLDEAHRAGIVHRDIKPDNLWLLPDRTVKVLDFGLARAWDVGSTIGANATMGHMLIGTPHYAQPEQVVTGKLTPASDVYSLGMILYELLTGYAPLFPDEPLPQVRARLQGDPVKWLIAHAKQDVVPIDRHDVAKTLPRQVVDLVHSTLAKEPAARPQSAGALANALAWILHHELAVAQAATLVVRYPSGAQRRHLLLPGVHRVGFGPQSDIKLSDAGGDRVYAVIEWAGSPRDAELLPIALDGALRINGHVLDRRVRLVPGTQLQMDAFNAELVYPTARQR